MSKLWILSAWHNFICETSVFLVNEDCLKVAGIDSEMVSAERVQQVYFGEKFSNVRVMEFELTSDSLLDDLPLDMELRAL